MENTLCYDRESGTHTGNVTGDQGLFNGGLEKEIYMYVWGWTEMLQFLS